MISKEVFLEKEMQVISNLQLINVNRKIQSILQNINFYIEDFTRKTTVQYHIHGGKKKSVYTRVHCITASSSQTSSSFISKMTKDLE